jgi:hypothetical protein
VDVEVEDVWADASPAPVSSTDAVTIENNDLLIGVSSKSLGGR